MIPVLKFWQAPPKVIFCFPTLNSGRMANVFA